MQRAPNLQALASFWVVFQSHSPAAVRVAHSLASAFSLAEATRALALGRVAARGTGPPVAAAHVPVGGRAPAVGVPIPLPAPAARAALAAATPTSKALGG